MDESVPFFDIIMKRPANHPVPSFPLPDGFRFSLFSEGDEPEWAKIETAVGEFDDETAALTYFTDKFLSTLEEAKKRILFIENSSGEKIATASAWWDFKVTGERFSKLHWVAVLPDFQSLGIGKALVTQITQNMIQLDGEQDFYLHTQTWSWKAIKLYKKFGYHITDEAGIGTCKNNHFNEAMSVLTEIKKRRTL